MANPLLPAVHRPNKV